MAAMSNNDTPKERLEQAVGRLEEALDQVIKKAGDGADAATRAAGERDELTEKVRILTADNESLRSELADAEQRHDDLRSTTEAVSQRLDATIAELNKMLDG
jgi:uncharacterized coiled-coil DUF342 family protein